MEMWSPPAGSSEIDRVILSATRLAAGIYGSTTVPKFIKQRSIDPSVMLTDLGVLLGKDMAHLGQARHRIRTHWADKAAAEAIDRIAEDEQRADNYRRAAWAPDYLGAAVRSCTSRWSVTAETAQYPFSRGLWSRRMTCSP